jgi:outer membrane protein OmpA-like peptidoglycan-associated protein
MKNFYLTPVVIAITVLIGACASAPTSTTQLEGARNDYRQVQNNPDAPTMAGAELSQASDAMRLANAAANDSQSADKVNQLAYVAQQKIALTQEVIKKKRAEAEAALAARERDQMRLNQRTSEADKANANAQQAQITAQQSQAVALAAQNDAALAQRKAEEARAQTSDAQARAGMLEAQLADLAARKTDRGMVITLGDVLFATAKADLNATGMHSAQKLADVLKQNPTRTVMVEGFADSTGGAAANLELSERRGMSVRDALMKMGVTNDRIQVKGYGESFPVAGNDSVSGRQMNRRVEIVLSDDSGKIKQR